MVKKCLAMVALLAVAAVPIRAELKVVSKLEIRKVDSTDPPNPFFAMMGQQIAQQMRAPKLRPFTTTSADTNPPPSRVAVVPSTNAPSGSVGQYVCVGTVIGTAV